MKTQNSIKRLFAIATLLFAMLATASADWITYDGSILPGDAGWNVKNGSGAEATITLVDDADNAGNKMLQFISGSSDKNTLEAPKFDSKVSGGGAKKAFTVVMRARALTITEDSTYKNFMEVEVKDGEIRDKVRFYPEKGLDIEKANAKELAAYPEGHNSYDFNIYRVTFKDGFTKIWVNDVLVDESAVTSPTTSDSDSRFVIGDSNSSADYGIEYDWIIWDTIDAYMPGEGADYPAGLILSPLGGGGEEGTWDIYDGSETPEAAGFSAGGSNTIGTSVILDDAENAGNKILDMRSAGSEKWYWSNNHKNGVDPDKGFTVVYRMSGITADSSSVGEMEVCSGGFRDKIRVYGSGDVNIEKAGVTFPLPDGVDVMDYNVYRVTFQRDIDGTDTTGLTKVWVNDIFVGEGNSTETSGSNKYTIGDSNSSKSYAALIDWVIREETGAYSPYDSPDYPAGIVLSPLTGGPIEVPDMLKFDDVNVDINSAAQTISDLGLEANVSWVIGSVDTWITSVTPLEGDSGVATFSVTVEENTGAAPRIGTVYGLIDGELMDELTITQDGQAVIIDALGAISSSAQVKDGITKDAPFAIDGFDSTAWVPVDAVVNGSYEWIKVAVAPSSEVVLVKMQEYKGHERAVVFSIDYWNGSAYVESAPQQILPAPGVANTEVAFALPAPITTDTVMFKIYGCVTGDKTASEASGWFTMSEVSVWGGEASALRDYASVEYNVYPNPTNGVFTIENAVGANVQVVSLAGQVVFEKNSISAKEQITLNLESGIYLLNVDDAVSKIVIK